MVSLKFNLSHNNHDMVTLRREFSPKIHENQCTQKMQWKEIIDEFMTSVKEVEINFLFEKTVKLSTQAVLNLWVMSIGSHRTHLRTQDNTK